jgi:hypothetical protein
MVRWQTISARQKRHHGLPGIMSHGWMVPCKTYHGSGQSVQANDGRVPPLPVMVPGSPCKPIMEFLSGAQGSPCVIDLVCSTNCSVRTDF